MEAIRDCLTDCVVEDLGFSVSLSHGATTKREIRESWKELIGPWLILVGVINFQMSK